MAPKSRTEPLPWEGTTGFSYVPDLGLPKAPPPAWVWAHQRAEYLDAPDGRPVRVQYRPLLDRLSMGGPIEHGMEAAAEMGWCVDA